MEPASALHPVSFRQNPRDGQKQVFDRVESSNEKLLNVQLPTGYGKTFVACGVYSILKSRGRVNRLFMVFPSDGQLEQFKQIKNNDRHDLVMANVEGSHQVVDLRFFGTDALLKHRKNSAQVFVTTVQSLITRNGIDIAGDLFGSGGRWMLCVDEYHHYGIDAAWGKAVLALPAEFTLAMSATPRRRNDDSAFGAPDIVVQYREAVEQRAVKPLKGHSYVYRLDVLDEDGDVQSVTTTDLVEMAGGDSPEKIDAFMVTRKMRWSPKYVSPLVSIPLERMITERVNCGKPLQAIIGAMSVSHAEMVCKQVEAMFGDVLTVDWVGTGEHGRKPAENRAIIRKFCPPKDENGNRKPELDILVHVGMAGEGLDSVLVSEVIHLNAANWNNSNDQENGRAARFIPDVIGHINFDSASEYARKGYIGDAIMDAMDNVPPRSSDPEPEPGEAREYRELPDEPAIEIKNLELDRIDSGDPGVQRMLVVIGQLTGEIFDDPSHPKYEIAIARAKETYREMRRREAEEQDEESIISQWRDAVNNATSAVTGLARKVLFPQDRFEKTVIGDLKRRINSRKKMDLGPIRPDVEVCRNHYRWIKSLERKLLAGEVPSWLQ